MQLYSLILSLINPFLKVDKNSKIGGLLFKNRLPIEGRMTTKHYEIFNNITERKVNFVTLANKN